MAKYNITQYSINQDFLNFCYKGKIKQATALLNSTNAKFTPDDTTLNQAVIEVYFHNKINVMKYLLTSSEIFKKPDINYKNNLLFRLLYDDKNYDLLSYLISDVKIKRTIRIIEELEKNPDPKVLAMFINQELNDELLLNKELKIKKTKI